MESGDRLIERAPDADVLISGSEVSVGNAVMPAASCNATSLCRSDLTELCPGTPSKCDQYDGESESMTAGNDVTDCFDRNVCSLLCLR